MMIGETHRHHHHHHHHCDVVPPWEDIQPVGPPVSAQASSPSSPQSPAAGYAAAIAALRQYLLAGAGDTTAPEDYSGDGGFPAAGDGDEDDDEFFMYEFKVRRCTRARAHDWTECPFAHPGEKARRRDPRAYSYSGTACSEFRKGSCRRGDGCEFAHGVFESWLHPSRYRTQACKDGPGCRRRVCFFAHRPDQLRPAGSGPGPDPGPAAELAAALRNVQLNRVKSMPPTTSPAPSSWSIGVGSPVFGSPRAGVARQAGFLSLPATPTQPRLGYLDAWDSNNNNNKEPQEGGVVMERVESGRELRARMFEKLSKENPLNGPRPGARENTGSGPDLDLGWVSDLIQ